MIICSDKNNVIELFKKANNPLNKEMVNSLEEANRKLAGLGLNLQWVVLELKCRVCNDETLCIVPQIADLDNLECDNCGNMTCQEKEPMELEND
jgi:hypothetical protein